MDLAYGRPVIVQTEIRVTTLLVRVGLVTRGCARSNTTSYTLSGLAGSGNVVTSRRRRAALLASPRFDFWWWLKFPMLVADAIFPLHRPHLSSWKRLSVSRLCPAAAALSEACFVPLGLFRGPRVPVLVGYDACCSMGSKEDEDRLLGSRACTRKLVLLARACRACLSSVRIRQPGSVGRRLGR